MNCKILRYKTLASTNKTLREMAENKVVPPLAVSAGQQTEGRGRLGKSFESPPGGVYISFLLEQNPEVKITCMAAVAVKRAISKIYGIECEIKWVNDLYYEGKKVCGILAQVFRDKVILGVGINLCDFTQKMPDIAGSLHRDLSKKELLEETLACEIYGKLEGWLEEYRKSDMLRGKKVDVIQAGQHIGCGIADGIDENGCLRVVEEDGNLMILSTGEVSLRLSK